MKLKFIKRLEIQVAIALIGWILLWHFFPQFINYVGWMWDMFMRLLKMFLGPLLFFSVFSAILSLGDFKKLGSIGARTMLYYMLTTTLAIGGSLILMNIVKPWRWLDIGLKTDEFNAAWVEQWLTFQSFIGGLIPDNIALSFLEFNAIQIVIAGIILGISILSVGKKKNIGNLIDITETINKWILEFISFVIKLTPFWVFGIVAWVVAENGIESMTNLLPFVYIILIALFLHAFITLPIIGYIIGWFHPYKYFMKVKEAVIVWFSTASSSATMGLSMNVSKEKWWLNDEVVNFTFPIGTTINMDGTALYQAWVAIFIAQVLGIDLSIMSQITMIIIVILASVWAAWIPWAGILILTTVFLSVWLPVEAIAIILSVDRVLDMFRTAVNVWGDLLTAKVIDKFYKKELS